MDQYSNLLHGDMGTTSSSVLKTQELGEFRKLNNTGQIEQLDIPERPDRRVGTNKKWLVVLVVALVVLVPFVIYALIYSDIRRLVYGTDECGNLCGHTNPKVDDVPCSGVDHTNEKYAQYESVDEDVGHCVRECPSDYMQFFFNCIKDEPESKRNRKLGRHERSVAYSEDGSVRAVDLSTDEAVYYLQESWWKILLSVFITIGIAIFGLFMFRFATAVLVWSILLFSTLVIVVMAIGFWIGYANARHNPDGGKGPMVAAIIMSVIALGVMILLAVLFKKIRLVIMLYKETTKAVFAMPLMILIPVITVILELIVVILLGLFLIWASTSGVLEQVRSGVYVYVTTIPIEFAMVYSGIMSLWVLQFLVGIQYMVIAGSVGTWYFSKDKPYMESPILTSFKNTVTFHLGTIALGAVIITLVSLVRGLIRAMIKNQAAKAVVECCLSNIEEFIKFLSKNAYIETALHGQAFFRSGKRAAKLLLANAGSLLAVNSVGDFVLGMAQLILIIIATGISYLFFMKSSYFWLPLVICFILNVLIIVVSFGVFETTVDTLFVCFCEDMVLNDGLSRPYAMSRGLMEFVEDSKLVYVEGNK